MKGILITIKDLESGETESKEIHDDYLVVCAGRRYIDHVQAHANGTHVVTIKVGQT